MDYGSCLIFDMIQNLLLYLSKQIKIFSGDLRQISHLLTFLYSLIDH